MNNLIEALRASARHYPSQPAILTDGSVIDHQTLAELSDRFAAGLAGLGVGPGERVALYCPNGAEFAIAYIGVVKAGAVVVPVNLLINPEEIAYILRDSGAAGWIYHASLSEAVARVDEAGGSPALMVEMGGAGEADPCAFETLIRSTHERPEPLIRPERDLAAILYTSGTTGFPKGAMLTHANLVANVASVAEAMQWRPGHDIVLVVLPMFHAFAATVGLLTPLIQGCALAPMTRFEPEAVAETIARHRATLFLGVPSMYTLLLRLQDGQGGRLASLRCAIAGGAAMPVEVLRRFEEKFGVPLYEGDGPTECSPVTCVNPVGGVAKPGTVGLPVPRVEMRVVDEAGRELPDGEVGEIAVRGPNVMAGYWNQPEATAEVFRDGWFLTGDLGTRDSDGYFSLIDRKKDLVIVNGMNVYPRMIEEVLHRLEGLREVAVIGEPSPLHGEVPVAYVVLEPGFELSEAELRRHCRAYLGRHQVPRRFEQLRELPRNAAGKIMKRELRQQGEWERGIRGLR